MADADAKAKEILYQEDVRQAEYAALQGSEATDTPPPQPLIALCLSGGGIRSATFCLGVLQALAAHRPQGEPPAPSTLERIHYLSTVSGGGYIGGWLTALIKRNEFDYGRVAQTLARSTPAARQGQAHADPIEWLRNHSSYLAPRRGWSADTWANIALYLRHLVINWFALVPLILAALLLPVVHLGELQSVGSDSNPPNAPYRLELLLFFILTLRHWFTGGRGLKLVLDVGTAVAAFGLAVWWFPHMVFSTWWFPRIDSTEQYRLVIAMAFIPFALLLEWVIGTLISAGSRRLQREPFRERLSRDGGRALAAALAWSGLHGLVFYLPSWILELGANAVIGIITAGGAAGIATALGGYWSRLPTRQRNRFRDKLGRASLKIAAALFIVFFLGGFGALLNMKIILAVVDGKDSKQPPPAAVQNYSDTRDFLLRRLNEVAPPKDTDKSASDKLPTAEAPNDANKKGPDKAPPAKDRKELLDEDGLAQLEQEAKGRLRSAARDVLEGTDSTMGRTLLRIEERLTAYARIYRDTLRPLPAPGAPFGFFVLFVAIAITAMGYLGVNAFSLTTFYGNRLIRAYLGASHPPEARKPDPDTGFDPNDDLPMSDAARADGKPSRLFHVVTGALNLSRGSRLRWQQRKASSFTISPLHAGSWSLGYQLTKAYGDEHGLSLGKAMAVSGAAVSPNMGYHTSPLVSFVLTFFNARLGYWLPNPGWAGRDVWKDTEPGLGDVALIKELVARADDEKRFVYISDGGHFDNLGIYEMVRRQCTRIVAIDATADPEFRYDDLSSVLAKIRVDFGVEIDFPHALEPQRQPEFLFQVATIRYPNPPGNPIEGQLIYVKPLVDDLVPLDVRRYAKNHNEGSDCFPHQSTANQFFNEDQFESYRMLGLHIMGRVLEAIGSLENPHTRTQPPLFRVTAGGAVQAAAAEAAPAAGGSTAVPLAAAGTGFSAPLSGALQTWGAAGVLSLGVAAGSVVGVAGTVALAPDQKVKLEETAPFKIDPVQFGELKDSLGALKVTVDKDDLEKLKNLSSTIGPLKITVDDTELQKVKNLQTKVTLDIDKKPYEDLQKTPLKLPVVIDEAKLTELLKKEVALGVTMNKELRELLSKRQIDLRVNDAQLKKLQDALDAAAARQPQPLSVTVDLSKLQEQLKDVPGTLRRIETNTRELGPRRSVIEGREGAR